MIRNYIGQQAVDDFGQVFASYKYSAAVAATTDTLLTVPGGAARFKALIKAGVDAEIWVALNEVADIPAGAGFAADTSELVTVNGEVCREVTAGDVLHFYSTAGGTVSVVFYAVI